MRNITNLMLTILAVLSLGGQAACMPVLGDLSSDSTAGAGSELLMLGLAAGGGSAAMYTVSGSLSDDFGQALANFDVECTSGAYSTTVRTDANGNFSVELLEGPSQCQAPGGRFLTLTIFADGSVLAGNSFGMAFDDGPAGPRLAVIPGDLRARGRDGFVQLLWTRTVGATSYTLYWNTVGGVTTADAQITGLTAPSYNHTGRTNGVTYYYRLAADNAAGTSEPGREVQAIANPGAPPTPEHFEARGIDGGVELSWEAVPRATEYLVFWLDTPGVEWTSPSVRLGPVTGYTHTGLVNGTPYYYRLVAIGTYGNSGLSAIVPATVGGD